MDDPLRIGRRAAIPLSEIELRTSRSSGPGGQHANVTASRVEAVFDVCASESLTGEQRDADRRAPRPGRAGGGAGHAQPVAQPRAGVERLRGRLEAALAVQRPRRATKPTAASRRRRAESKRRRGELKRLRRPPEL